MFCPETLRLHTASLLLLWYEEQLQRGLEVGGENRRSVLETLKITEVACGHQTHHDQKAHLNDPPDPPGIYGQNMARPISVALQNVMSLQDDGEWKTLLDPSFHWELEIGCNCDSCGSEEETRGDQDAGALIVSDIFFYWISGAASFEPLSSAAFRGHRIKERCLQGASDKGALPSGGI
ncbi:hypothetical protein NQZ68_035673 [Dissostichus eleginoides]|nr:hypothetical protein NQZ68_035673 [Dissostichus eleginoides]